MGMDLHIKTEAFAAGEDQRWLGSAHGTVEADSITLNADVCLTVFPTGVIPSGVVLGKITATGLYVPYTAAGTHGAGSEVAAGHLLTKVDLGGTTAATVENMSAALYWHGEVVEAKLPAGHGLDGPAKLELPQIRYV